MSRRALLLAGGATILAGCGKEAADRAAEVTPADALRRQLAAERALAGQLTPAPGRTGEIHDRARKRAERLAAALSAAGGRPHAVPEPEASKPDMGAALDRARAALVTHVTALPVMTGGRLRTLGADMVAGSAADLAVLEDMLGSPSGDAFPGTPA